MMRRFTVRESEESQYCAMEGRSHKMGGALRWKCQNGGVVERMREVEDGEDRSSAFWVNALSLSLCSNVHRTACKHGKLIQGVRKAAVN